MPRPRKARHSAVVFQAQAQDSIDVPKEYHRLILGKQAARLKELEKESGASIKVPAAADASTRIQVTGPRDAIRRATALIKQISDEQVGRWVG
ncbi:hypothetical protein LSTR_LSTR016257 [Laodelphax striatellus]|uniref:K Homology domain-containing protein n=1 Tax=Laodelphax striatellus TaxID=195883 RepID=A0A482XK40_LAOST|nr:hypothetical protein LSTR_LSTR016257 [Laodelphax striatellus]